MCLSVLSRLNRLAIGVITSVHVFVCVSVISGRMRVIERRWSVGFKLIIMLVIKDILDKVIFGLFVSDYYSINFLAVYYKDALALK